LLLPTEGAARTFLKPMLSRFPIYLPAVWENASEKPQKNHWNEMTPTDMTDNQISDKADFLRARPE
jgi:hypothetical protein